MKDKLERLEALADNALAELESRELVALTSKQLLTIIKLINEIQKSAQAGESEGDAWLDELCAELEKGGPKEPPRPGLRKEDLKTK